jgi:RHS repeat-associated protein
MGAVASVVTMCLIFSMFDSGARSADANNTAAAKPAPAAYAVKGAKTVEPKAPAPKTSMTIAGKSAGVYEPSGTALPAAATGKASFAAAGAGTAGAAAPAMSKTAIAGTPLWAQQVSAASGPSGVSATVASQAAAKALGVDGVVFEVSPSYTASVESPGQVRIGLDYAAFKDAYGGDFGSRLELYTLPACALTTPKLAECRVRTPVSGQTNDSVADSLSGVVDLGAGARSSVIRANTGTQATVLAASSGPGEEGAATGNYAASAISPDGAWAAGNSTGDFTYDYSITDPSSSGSLSPEVALNYNSGSVDGKTSLTNAQSSWVGDGWAAPADDYITQSFVPCDDDPEGTASANPTLDMCYDGEILTMDLNGSSTTIVDDAGTFKLQDDNGAVITHETSSGKGQGTYNTDYWIITERDGTSYYFGLNELPGYTSSNAMTDSVDWEPVYSAHSVGDPCYNSTWADSVCDMAYKWHLDYVTDTHGDAMAYYYNQVANYYGENSGATNAKYIRDSYLKEIDYGFTTSTGPYGLIPDKIVFNGATRCVSSTCATLSSSMSPTTAASEYPDVPVDLLCASGATCPIDAPSFFSTELLSSISTEQYSPSTSAYVPVDSYTLTQDFPATGDSSSGTLWLESILHDGQDTTAGGSTSQIGEPSVTFSGTDLPNRWDTATYPGLYRWRVDEVVSELGSKTSATYSIPDSCAANTSTEPSATPSSNTTSCYPVYWAPPTLAPIEDWFIKYAVTEVTVQDQTGGNEEQVTQYSYADPAWHYDDNAAVEAAYRTYGEFRGYQGVTTLIGNGTSDAEDKTTSLYYQGMYGDYLTPTTTSTTTVADSFGDAHADYDALAGDMLEQDVYRGDSTTLDSSTIDDYWVSGATASQSVTGLPTVTAQMAGPTESFTQTMTTDGGVTGWDYSETDDSYDTTTTDPDFGLLLDEYTHAWTSSNVSGEDVDDTGADYAHCATYTYAPVNTSENLVGLQAAEQEVSAPCAGFTEGSPAWIPSGTFALSAPSFTQAQLVFATADFYDQGGTFTTTFAPQTSAPGAGNLTETALATGYSGGVLSYQMNSEDTYDSYGRPQDAYDGDGNETITSYTVTDGLTTAESVENALSQTTHETLDPTRALPLTSTDANGVVTTRQYDAIGRITSEWDDSRYSPTVTTPANYLYSYTESDTGLSGSQTQTMDEEEGYAISITILDSLGRTRQTQASTPDGGTLVTDTFHNSLGQTSQVNDAWWDSTATPSISLATASSQAAIPNWDQYTYDGLGNQVEDRSMTLSNAVYDTTYTVDSGDKVTTVPDTTSISPIAGGTIETEALDPLGRQDGTALYSAGAALPTLTVPANLNTGVMYVSGGTALTTSYGYDAAGNQTTTADPDGDSWTDAYNPLGEETEETDPTSGDVTNMEYDADGNLEQSEDSRGDYLSYTYDKLGRETGEYASTLAGQTTGASGNQTDAWVYDNSNNAVTGMADPIGQLTTESVYSGGQTYSLQYKGFDKFGKSTGETYTIGSGAGDLAGTYKYAHSYSTNTGLPLETVYNSEASGTLPAETVSTNYASTGGIDEPSTVTSALGSYATDTYYDGYSRVSELQIGTGSDESLKKDTYDVHTGNLLTQAVTNSSTTNDNVDNVSYSYNSAGDVTAETDERAGSTSDEETQCFNYNSLEQLTTAYSSTSGCGTAPTSGNYSMVGNTIGNGSAYWDSWTYDNEGDRASQDAHSLTNPADDADTSYTYNTGVGSQAHTLASTATTVNGTQTASTSYGYDAAGDTTTRTTAADGTQTIGWNNAGELTSVASTTKGDSSYIYNAQGGLLVQTDGTTTTLYLETEQLSYNSSTSAYSGDRYYALPGGGNAVRAGSGDNYTFEFSDQHNTNDLTLDFTAQDAAWRQFDPYGNPRGTATAWVDNRAFLDDPDDATTGLTDISARWYDPTIGDFVSLDPILEIGDPLALGGYAYTDDDPVTELDETGESIADIIGYISDVITIGGGGVGLIKYLKGRGQKQLEASKPDEPDPFEGLNAKLDQIAGNLTEAATLKAQLESSNAENAGLKDALDSSNAENAGLKDALESSNAENTSLKAQIQNLTSQSAQDNAQAAQDLAEARSQAAAYKAAAEREAEARAAAERAAQEAKAARNRGDGDGDGDETGSGGKGDGGRTTSADGEDSATGRSDTVSDDEAVEQAQAEAEATAEEAEDQDADGWDQTTTTTVTSSSSDDGNGDDGGDSVADSPDPVGDDGDFLGDIFDDIGLI